MKKIRNRLQHKHLLIKAIVQRTPKDENESRQWVNELIDSIDMKVAVLSNNQSNPIAWYSEDPENQGMTAGGILTTSHTMFHTWDAVTEDDTYEGQPAEVHFDLYSCKCFNVDDVLAKLDAKFGLRHIHVLMLDRSNFTVEAMFMGPYQTYNAGI